jgi:hypothetical protein
MAEMNATVVAAAAGHRNRDVVGVTLVRSLQRVIQASPKGWTLDPRRCVVPRFDGDHYLVSLRGHERRFAEAPTKSDLQRWVKETIDDLRRDAHVAGGWTSPEDGLLYLDVSIIVRGLGAAVRIGRANGQKCIYRPAADETIWLIRKIKASLDLPRLPIALAWPRGRLIAAGYSSTSTSSSNASPTLGTSAGHVRDGDADVVDLSGESTT